MSEIKPCPFCGREPEAGVQNGCVRCPAHVGWHLAEQWDCRPVEDALREALKDMTTERDRLRAEGQALDARNFHLAGKLSAAEGQREALRAERDRLRALICEWDAAEVAHAEALTRLMKGYAQTSQKWKGTVRRRDAANAALAGEVKP